MTLVYLFLVLGFAAVFVLLIKIWQKAGEKKDNQGELLLNQRLDNVTKLILDELKESRQTVQQSSLAVHQQVQNFTQGITKLQEGVRGVHDSLKDVVSFQDIFKSPKIRGGVAETMLEALLTEYLPKDSYTPQYYFKSGEAVDMVIKLPDGKLLPIDAKFPLENYQKFISSKDETERDYYRKAFFADVKKKIDSISGKYILPSEGTVKHAFMYIPAESIYYEIINDIDMESYARSKRIIMVSPNILYPYLVAIRGYYKEIYVTKETEKIIKKLDKVSDDGVKLDESFRRLGKHLSDAQSSYNTSEGRLKLMLSKVEDISEIGKEEKEESRQIKEVEETTQI